jgi:hypothetical protein
MSNVAQTIAQQIGSRAFTMMGAKQIMAAGDCLKWKVTRNSKRVTHVVVTLQVDDTYTVQTWSVRGLHMKLLNTVHGVYVDALQRTLQSETGLYLSL